MKKIFALTLAAVMAMGSATVAFATPVKPADPLFPSTKINNDSTKLDSLDEIWMVQNDEGKVTPTVGEIAKGKTVYIPLRYEVATSGASSAPTPAGIQGGFLVPTTANRPELTASDMKKYKVKFDLLVGKDIFKETPKIEYVKFEGRTAGTIDDFYAWAVALPTETAYTTALEDVAGTLTIYRTSVKNYNASPAADAGNMDTDKGAGQIAIAFGTYGNAAVHLADDLGYTLNNDTPVVEFSKINDDVTIEIPTVGTIDVNVENQDKLNLKYSTKYIADIGDKYADAANLEFVNFPAAPAFYKTAVVNFYTANKDAVIYQYADGKLTKLESSYNADDEAIKFATKKLGTYVISDKELDTKLVETAKPIPDTGR